jgi:BlaI family transcriptional regulator, penicillinase repressor
MSPATPESLSRRERQIMELLYQHGECTVADVRARLADGPSYSAVRALLRTLETKGHAYHIEDGPRFVYRPATSRARAQDSAIQHLVRTFFGGSTADAAIAMIGSQGSHTAEELARLAGR